MPQRQHSPQFKKRIIDEVDSGSSHKEVAKRNALPLNTVYAWTKADGRAHVQKMLTRGILEAQGNIRAARAEAAHAVPATNGHAAPPAYPEVEDLRRENAVLKKFLAELLALRR
jgi:transposase-like protein